MTPESIATRTLVALLGHEPARVVSVVHHGPPKPKGRPRFDRRTGRAYTPARTRAAETALLLDLKRAIGGRRFDGEVVLVAVFVLPNRRRVDADNLVKTVMDAGTRAGAWADDSQVTATAQLLELDAAWPRTIVAMADRPPSLGRKATP